ncbi:hypothetical protein CN204_34015 [Sinorhizobium meliloti]|nr:hypothetical protein CN204_34015 [Sinorhizobium meliloti]RVN98483.1 hypothetical protein CN102_34045 [Sinorhizobium meliloti]
MRIVEVGIWCAAAMRVSSAETTSAPDSILYSEWAAVRAQVQEVVDAVSQLPRERHLYRRGASIWPPLSDLQLSRNVLTRSPPTDKSSTQLPTIFRRLARAETRSVNGSCRRR